jgi:hypothetical protein
VLKTVSVKRKNPPATSSSARRTKQKG